MSAWEGPVSKVYILFDGRAADGDTDDAAILETFTSGFRRGDYKFWKGTDAVLYQYVEANGVLTHERKVGHLDDGWDILKGRL